MPPVKTAVPGQAAPVYDAYLGWLAARGVGNHTFDSGARCFLARFPDPQAWAALPLAARLASTRPHLQPLLNFLMLHGHLRPGYDYLLDRKLTSILREAHASPLGADLARFLAGAEALGTPPRRGEPAGAQADDRLPGTAARDPGPVHRAGRRLRAGALRPVPRPSRPWPALAGAAGPAAPHRAVPERGRGGGQPPHRPADRRLHRQAAHPVRRQLPGRDRRVGMARGPGPAPGLPPRCAQAAAPAAPLPATGLRTGAAGRAGGIPEPAAR